MHSATFSFLISALFIPILGMAAQYTIDEQSPVYFKPDYFSPAPGAGDTIFVSADRTKALIFKDFSGGAGQPLVIINQRGQVAINTSSYSCAIDFRDCHHIQLSGAGEASHFYGFRLRASNCGVAFSGLSSHCEIAFAEIDHDGFFGIVAKKDYKGNPPSPTPTFEHLIIHDCLIKNVTEGMYIGETKTPGMEFHHVRIFNNIVYATGRESIQISNATEDVAVYNNLLWKAGRDGAGMHGNNLQIGDNTVGRFYNNLLIDAQEHGIILMGSGDVDIYNNYLAENKGIYIDERSVTIADAPLLIRNNFFSQMKRPACIINRNEPNPLRIHDNQWQGASEFLSDKSDAPENTEAWNNPPASFALLPALHLSAPFELPQDAAADFQGMGPQPGLSFELNERPELNEIKDQIIDWETEDTIALWAPVSDGDSVLFQYDTLPAFASFQLRGNGEAWLILQPAVSDEGVYELAITAADASHQDKSRLRFTLAVRDPDNSAPQLQLNSNWMLENLRTHDLPIPCTDPEGHEVQITAEGLPSFARLRVDNSAYRLQLKPLFHQAGTYTLFLYAADAFGGHDTLAVHMTITQRALNPGDPVLRVNCGGPALADSLLDWQDAYHQVTPYELTPNHRTGPHSWSGDNTTGAPDDLFGPFAREQPWGDQEMYWSVPCPAGNYRVNLYFAERQRDIDKYGAVAFDIYLNGERVADGLNIYEEAGLAALKKSFGISLQEAGHIDLEFVGEHFKPKINGLEVLYMGSGSSGAVAMMEQPTAAAEAKANRAPQPAGRHTLKQAEATRMKVYPNPAVDHLQVEFAAPAEGSSFDLTIVDAQGQPVHQEQIQAAGDTSTTLSLNRSGLPAGFYSLQLLGEGKPEVAAVVLQ